MMATQLVADNVKAGLDVLTDCAETCEACAQRCINDPSVRGSMSPLRRGVPTPGRLTEDPQAARRGCPWPPLSSSAFAACPPPPGTVNTRLAARSTATHAVPRA